MQPNDKITCPACKEASIAKLKNKMDGFTKVGQVLVCMLCGAELETYKAPETAISSGEKKLGELGLLLGAVPSATVRLAAADDEKRFCKDCKHFLKHPFVDRCDIDNKPVDPMDDCGNFEKRAVK
ncbi:MAG: hypothetical protein E7039_09860 [Lentisphaerae bacterium]|nr:hypothetical protein [Lentisphaerota bacterium]